MKTETMPKDRTTPGGRAEARYDELKQLLTSRRRELRDDLQGRMRSVRDEGPRLEHAVITPGESEVDAQDDLEFVLMAMKSEMANKIDEALARLEEGSYGLCYECGEPIAPVRLRALPFAVRCKDCEEAIEIALQSERSRARRGSSPLGFELRG